MKAENHFQQVKRNLTKLELKRSQRGNRTATIDFLAAAHLYRCPGLHGVICALERYQKAMIDRVEPKSCFVTSPWLDSFDQLVDRPVRHAGKKRILAQK